VIILIATSYHVLSHFSSTVLALSWVKAEVSHPPPGFLSLSSLFPNKVSKNSGIN
jgi:hypothetical protein